jgi:dUTP pyrophosphatase
MSFIDPAARDGDEAEQRLLMPAKASAHSAGSDLIAANAQTIEILPGQWAKIPTGIAISLPNGFEAQVRPRSGMAAKHGVTVLNAPGTIDADYRGEIAVLLINHGPEVFRVNRGMRIAQMIVAPVSSFEFVQEASLEPTHRGTGGFGSTGTEVVVQSKGGEVSRELC